MTTARYDSAETLLKLVLALQSTRQGLSLDEMADQHSVSRRTVERLRDAVARLYDDELESTTDFDGVKRWRLRRPKVIAPSQGVETLAALEIAAKLCDQANMSSQSVRLNELHQSLRSHLPAPQLNRIETDLEALTLAEGIAIRQAPHIQIDHGVFYTVRQAILQCSVLNITYLSRSSQKRSYQQIYPYGFVYAHQPYLVAFTPYANDWRYFQLGGIEQAALCDEHFTADPAFSLTAFCAQSFGVFQEPPQQVHLAFAADAAADAAKYHFHPTQRVEWQPDGTLDIRFTAGGLNEMCWHLFRWGDSVRIISPPDLRQRMREWCEAAMRHI